MLKLIVILIFVAIVWSLGSALFHMMRSKDNPELMARALTKRIALSVVLFLGLVFALYMGWIDPNTTPIISPSK